MTDTAGLSFLDELGRKYATDKSSTGKSRSEQSKGLDYLKHYERFLEPRRGTTRKVLEIGVLKGASLRVWRDYFPDSTVFGLDIHESALRVAAEGIHIHLVDQSDRERLETFARDHGPFDLIVEDGSHLWEHQINCLKWLLPHVRSGGVYIVEDLQTSYNSEYGSDTQRTAVEHILDQLEDIIAGPFKPKRTARGTEHAFDRVESAVVMKHAVAFMVA